MSFEIFQDNEAHIGNRCGIIILMSYRKLMIVENKDLKSAKTEKIEWLAPKISYMNVQATENGANVLAAEQQYFTGRNTNNFGGS